MRIKCVLLAATLVTNPQYEMDSDYDKNSRPSEYLIRISNIISYLVVPVGLVNKKGGSYPNLLWNSHYNLINIHHDKYV